MLKQIEVARAHKKVTGEETFDSHFLAEEKMDGARYKLHTFDQHNRIDSRRVGVNGLFVEKTDNVPHIRDMDLPSGWVVDSEIIARHGATSHDKCANTVSIMGSLPDRAGEVQREHGLAVMNVFDVLFAAGKDIRQLPFEARLPYLEKFMTYVDPEHVKRMRTWSMSEVPEAYKQVTEIEMGEGLMIKDLRSPYGARDAWWKMKRQFTMDVVATGRIEPGKGKYKGTVGALYFGLFENGKLVEVGKCSGMSDAVRDSINKAVSVKGLTFEIGALDITAARKIRNANFKRWRPDKNAAECTFALQMDQHDRR